MNPLGNIPETRIRPRSGNVLLGVLFLVAVGLMGCNTTGSPATIEGFEGVAWGSSPETVLNRFGPPSGESVKEGDGVSSAAGRSSLVYRNQSLLGDSVTTTFIFDDEENLVRGFHWIPFGRGNDCQETYEKIESMIQETYRGMTIEHKQFNQLRVRFCYAVRVGHAGQVSRWTDPAGNRITLLLGYGIADRRLLLLYESKGSSKRNGSVF